MENQFFHVKLASEAYKFFGFAILDNEGTERYYCFKVMVYGFAPAVAVVTRLVRPAQAYLHERGVERGDGSYDSTSLFNNTYAYI